MKKTLTRLLSVLFWLAVWMIASLVIGQDLLLVSPISAFTTLFRLMGTSHFYLAVLNSFARILAGFLLGTVLGLALAVLAHKLPAVKELLYPVMIAIKATPVASFVILALLFISSKNLSIFASFLMVLPVIYTNVSAGFESADPQLLQMAQVYRLNARKRLKAIYIPAAFPYFISACQASLGMSWKAGIAAEVIGQPANSIGDQLYRAKIFLSTSELFAWTMAIILISVVFERIALRVIGRIQRRLEGS